MEIIDIEKCFIDLQGVDAIKKVTKKALENEIPIDKILEAMKRGLDTVGEKYEKSEYFLSDIIMAGIMATELTNIITPHVTSAKIGSKGRIVIGTVQGDIHDIGKNLVATMLSTHGYEVIDIGVDVPSEKFLDSLKRYKPKILAMSCLLTIGIPSIEKTVNRVRQEGWKNEILIGGRPITEEFAYTLGVNYAKDAFLSVKIADRLIEEGKDDE